MTDAKDVLRFYLQGARDALVWKLDGLSEYDIRRPLTPTGTNLLGLVKHATFVESGYLVDTFGRESGLDLPWLGRCEPGTDMWATSEESRTDIVAGYRRAWARSDETLAEHPLDATGRVPWWPADDNAVTLQHALVRVISDSHRHAGHADIVREVIDGQVGMHEGNSALPSGDPSWWEDRRVRIEHAACEASRAHGRASDGPHSHLIAAALDVVNPHPVGRRLIGHVGAALVTSGGNLFQGVCVDTGSGTGFCAEAAAIAAMVTAGQFRISRIVAVWASAAGEVYVLPPCGRCREFIRQIDPDNLDTDVITSPADSVPLRELLPAHDWPESIGPLLKIE